MDWYSGDLGSCIQKVKQDKTLLFVFLKDDSDLSNELQTTLDIDHISSICKDAVCLKLENASTPFIQFSSVYEVPSIPCIHLILPAGSILSVRASEFAEDQLSDWLTNQMKIFKATSEVKFESTSTISPTQGPSSSVESPDQQLKVKSTDSEDSGKPALEDRVKLARKKLEQIKHEKAIKEFQETHENEIQRRSLGKNMSEFKARQREQEIKERLAERRREQEENNAARARVLQQIELDRKDRFGATASRKISPVVAPTVHTASSRASSSDNEARLQLRLPDGALMIATFSAEATLAGEVRQLISHKVFPSVDMDADSDGSLPLSESVRHSFEPVVSRGYTFKQMIPPRLFSTDQESRTLRELDLVPSAVLVLLINSSSSSSPSPYANGSILGYSLDLLSQLVNGVSSGLQAGVNFMFSLGQSIWGTLSNAGGNSGRVTRTETPSTVDDEEASGSRGRIHESSNTHAYRRQGKITRLSHMPDDTDEEARWNGNSTTQL